MPSGLSIQILTWGDFRGGQGPDGGGGGLARDSRHFFTNTENAPIYIKKCIVWITHETFMSKIVKIFRLPTDRPADKPTPRISYPELKNRLAQYAKYQISNTITLPNILPNMALYFLLHDIVTDYFQKNKND